jgi:hypothetical protein
LRVGSISKHILSLSLSNQLANPINKDNNRSKASHTKTKRIKVYESQYDMDASKQPGGENSEPLMTASATIVPDGLPAASEGIYGGQSSSAAAAAATVEGTGYNWGDSFFDQTDGVIAVFDFDYNQIEEFQWQMTKVALLCPVLCPFTCLIPSLFCVPCFAKSNIGWAARAQHVAVHRDGIKYVRDKRKTCCGLVYTDQGKNSKTVPFDKLTGE